MLTIAQRGARLGSSINTRVEKHGDEDVTAFDIPLDEIMLDAGELAALLGEPHAHTLLFDTSNIPHEPIFRMLKDFRLKEKIDSADVTLFIGLERVPIKFTDVKLARISIEPMVGGLTRLAVQVQCTPNLESKVLGLLFEKLGAEIDVEISSEGHGAQAQLPLGGASDSANAAGVH